MMETIVLIVALLAAGLVMAGGLWVAVVLIATVARVKPPVVSAREGRATDRPNPYEPPTE